MLIASSSRYFNNKNMQKNIDYMPFVYKKYAIDSARFSRSNYFYMSRIDEYQVILEEVKNEIEKEKAFYTELKDQQDSIRKDSINKVKLIEYQKKDSLKRSLLQENKVDTTPSKAKTRRNTDSILKAVRKRLRKRSLDTLSKEANQ